MVLPTNAFFKITSASNSVMNSCQLLGRVMAWFSNSALLSIKEVTLRRARLVLGWVTVRGFESISHRLTI